MKTFLAVSSISFLALFSTLLLPQAFAFENVSSDVAGSQVAAAGGSGSGSGAGGSGTGASPTVKLQNPLSGIGTIPELVAALLKVVVQIGVPVIIFFLVYVGFLFVTARGNEEQISRAKNAFLWTVIGGVILLGAQLLASVVENTVKQITG